MNTTHPIATLELGLGTFGDVTVDADGRLLSEARGIRDVIAPPVPPAVQIEALATRDRDCIPAGKGRRGP
jgi:hypothetical protein